MTGARVIVADDEPLARERVRTLLAAHEGVHVIAECEDGNATLEAIRRLRPDLVFLDIQMPELDGFDVLDALHPDEMPAVIFVTAYDSYALKAFEVHAIDYLLKPFTRERFAAAVEAALRRPAAGQGVEARVRALLDAVRAERRGGERIAVRVGEDIRFLKLDEVDWMEAARNYVRLHAGGQFHVVRDTLKNIEARLDPRQFVRVHRSAIVNLERIERLEPWFHGEFIVHLRDGTRLTSSRTYSDRLRAMTR